MRPPFSMWWKTLLFSLWLVTVVSWAADNKNLVSKPEDQSIVATTKGAIKMTLMPSRQQAVAGSYFGITTRIENTSNQTIYFTPKTFLMIAPPDLDPSGPRNWTATFPIPPDPKIDPNNYYWADVSKKIMTLPPGCNISAFFSMREDRPEGIRATIKLWLQNFFRGLSFSPGKYTLTVVGQYWDSPVDNPSLWQTQSEDIQEDISAPQSTILFGATLGGIFAFLLVWRDSHIPSADTHWGWSLVSAILLSIIVTILLSRLSESQFIIRVTVSDLWGAMAVGFIGAASGPSILQRFINALRGTPPQPKPEEPKAQTRPAPLGTKGIIVAPPKIYDNYYLQQLLSSLRGRLETLQVVDQSTLLAHIGQTQGANLQQLGFSFQGTGASTPTVTTGSPTTTNPGTTTTTTPLAASNPTPSPTTLTLPTIGQSSLDTLNESMQLAYEITNVQLLLNGATSDQIQADTGLPRNTFTVGFPITILPPEKDDKQLLRIA